MTFGPNNLKSYVCVHVFLHERGTRLVVHDSDGDWAFACGHEDHSERDWRVVGVGHLTDEDPSLHDCADLPVGYEAERIERGAVWARRAIKASP